MAKILRRIIERSTVQNEILIVFEQNSNVLFNDKNTFQFNLAKHWYVDSMTHLL